MDGGAFRHEIKMTRKTRMGSEQIVLYQAKTFDEAFKGMHGFLKEYPHTLPMFDYTLSYRTFFSNVLNLEPLTIPDTEEGEMCGK